MKRIIAVALSLLLVLALVWFVSPLFHGRAAYVVEPGADGKVTLMLRVERPGLFVDLVTAPEGPALAGESFAPWPGSARRRVATWFRGPLEFSLAEGEGPFLLRDLPVPVGGTAPEVQLPEGWTEAGPYVGPFIQTGGLWGPSVAAAMAEVTDKMSKLLTVAEAQFNRPLVKRTPLVPMGADPMALASAAVDRWVPDYGPELRWLETGLTQHFAVQLLDETALWSAAERSRWLREHRAEKGYAIATWLDANLKLNRQPNLTLDDLLLATQEVRSTTALIKVVNDMAGLSVADHLERMLAGKEPLPVSK